MQGVNVGRGLFRLWLVASAAWLALMGFVLWQDVLTATRGRYQYAPELKGDLKPWEQFDNKKPIEERFVKPSEAKWPAGFVRVEYQYQQGFDDRVKSGSMALVDFPDGSSLYLYRAFGQSEQELVARQFWDDRWQRRWTAFRDMSGIVLLALIPPMLLLGLWFVGRWIVAGFQRA